MAAPDDDSRIKLLEEIEERYFSTLEHVAETDKAWDALHRSLADGQLSYDSGLYPLSYVVLGGEQLVRDRETGYTMSLKTPPEVVQSASALDELTVDEFSTRYYSILRTSTASRYQMEVSRTPGMRSTRCVSFSE